jgi:N-carbamoyl-L-amino-acid hydrolase
VIYALEVSRAISEDDSTKHLPLDIGSWIDEEGTYLDCLGAHSFLQTMSDEQIHETANTDGATVGQVIKSAGLKGVAPARMEPDRHVGYLEAHIEQGPLLEAQGKRIGIVTAIVGVRTFWLTFLGEQNHAGTTPMSMRKDAGDALIRFGYKIQKKLRELVGERTVFTITRVSFDPGMDGIIPGKAQMNLQFRDTDESLLDQMEGALRDHVDSFNENNPVKVEIKPRPGNEKSAIMDAEIQEHMIKAAKQHAPGNWITMPSGAAHDAMIFAKRMPAAMLFVPSIGGISHDFTENTDLEDIVLGCQVLATATASILEQINGL